MTKQRIPKWWKPRKFPTWQYTALSDHYVYCDEHTVIHDATDDFYQEGNEFCNEENWRPVYVATEEEGEEF